MSESHLRNSSFLLQHGPSYLVLLTWLVCEMGSWGRTTAVLWGCCFQDFSKNCSTFPRRFHFATLGTTQEWDMLSWTNRESYRRTYIHSKTKETTKYSWFGWLGFQQQHQSFICEHRYFHFWFCLVVFFFGISTIVSY